MASLFYWIWAFPQRITAYKSICRQSGHGSLGWLYKDFGNIFATDFISWWKGHQLLFTELNESKNEETGIGLNYWLDPSKHPNQIHEETKALHLCVQSSIKNSFRI